MQIFSITLFLGLLAFHTAWAKNDFKDDFGEEFGEALRRYNAELLQSNMDGLKEFFTLAVENFNLNARDQRAFRQRISTIDVMKNRIGDKVTPQTVKATAGFSKVVLMELLMYRASPAIAGDSEKATQFDKAMKKCAEGEVENINVFLKKLETKWNKMYETIPKEELERYAQYKDINESINDLVKMDDSVSGVLQRAVALVQVLGKVSEFFDYDEWNSLKV